MESSAICSKIKLKYFRKAVKHVKSFKQEFSKTSNSTFWNAGYIQVTDSTAQLHRSSPSFWCDNTGLTWAPSCLSWSCQTQGSKSDELLIWQRSANVHNLALVRSHTTLNNQKGEAAPFTKKARIRNCCWNAPYNCLYFLHGCRSPPKILNL